MKKKFTLILISLLFSVNTISQDKKNEKKKEKTISELTKSSKKNRWFIHYIPRYSFR